MSEPSPAPAQVDLTTCEREPIHLPGAVQPHGVLLALDPDGLEVLSASANSATLLARAPAELTGRPVEAALGEEQGAALRRRLGATPDRADGNPLGIGGVTSPAGAPLHALVHRHEGVTVLELEPASGPEEEGLVLLAALIRDATGRLQRARSTPELAQALAEEVKALTGFDRVMVYRFDAEWAGDVIAEAVDDGFEPYLGLHYPASDIPAQARRLYHLNWTRAIPDATYAGIALEPALDPRTGRPFDLSYAALRSVSPIHLQYLANMGSTATLTISLMRGERLWGLISCHHHSGPKPLPYPLRAATEFLGQVVSLQVSGRVDSDEQALRARLAEDVAALSRRLASGEEPFPESLLEGTPTLLDLGQATGALVRYEGRLLTSGEAPEDAAAHALLDRLLERAGDAPVLAADDLGDADVAGALLARIGRRDGECLALLRPEVRRTVDWAGDPRKPVQVDATDGSQRLLPRGSFALWQETVKGRSLPWHEAEVRAFDELRRAVQDVVLRHAAELASLNAELARSNAELDQFAHIASHDLREPLRGLSNSAAYLLEDHAEELSEDAVARIRTLTRLTGRMEDLVESLLQVSQVGRLELAVGPVDLGELWAGVCDLHGLRAEQLGIELRAAGDLPTVVCDAVRVREVYANLLSNALKYHDADKAERVVEAGAAVRGTPAHPDAEQLCLVVRDNGIGIREKHLETIFRLFKRLHTQNAYGGGTGAGLTIARKVVELHGGVIWAESQPGEGTEMWFTLAGPPPAAP